MSSTYRILCLSHDPALTRGEFHTPGDAETAIANGYDTHPGCDLVIGRWSGALVEVGCPASSDQPATLSCHHGNTIWADKTWLLLLAAAYQSTDPDVQQAIEGRHHCMSWERLRRLRNELGFTIKEK
ncbi:hypothetical protein [Streptomyces longwoodensis]|uniref:hypothetical protein n=1 Tax=Streptomyces longwoodensis TaxID=68231 RepID=UPI0036E5CDE4